MSASRCSMVSFWQVKQPHVQPLFSESKAQIVFHTPKLYSQTHPPKLLTGNRACTV